MKRYIGAAYHASALIHHVYAMKYTTEIEFSKSTDPIVTDMELFANRYFTGWNMAIQTIYLLVAVITDVLHVFPKSLRQYENKLLMVKGYIFTTFMFPCALFVSGMFWSLYSINREWILPAVVDAFIPEWLNHSVHTVILIPAIIEIIIANNLMPSFKSALLGLSVLKVIYDSIFFYTYYQSGRWIYALFYVINWEGRVFMTVLNYICVVIALKIGIYLQNSKGKWMEMLYNCSWPSVTNKEI